MIEWVQNNVAQIVISVVSLAFGALVSYVFYRLQKRDVISAQQERVKRAVEELVGILESYVVNKQRLSIEAINNLLRASERAYGISLTDVCTPESLLQDVSLRLQKSRHLDIEQKSEYANQIVELIERLRDEERREPLTADSGDAEDLLSLAREAVQQGETEKAIQLLQRVSDSLGSLKNLPPSSVSLSTRKSQFEILSVALIGAMASFITLWYLLMRDGWYGDTELFMLMVVIIPWLTLFTYYFSLTFSRRFRGIQMEGRRFEIPKETTEKDHSD